MTSSGGEYISPHLNQHGNSHSAAQVNKHLPHPPAASTATTPHTQIITTSHALNNNSLISNNATNIEAGVTSYLVASSPEVLTQLLRENESRGIDFNPSLYIQPANALNTTKVDFATNSTGSGGVVGSSGRNSNSPLLPQSPLPSNKSSHLRHYLQSSASAAQQPMSMPPAFTTAGGGHAVQTNTTTRSQPGSGHSTLSRSGSYGAGSAGSCGGGSLEKRVASWQQRGRKQSLPAMAIANSGGLGSSQVEPCLLNDLEFGGWNYANWTNILKEKNCKNLVEILFF